MKYSALALLLILASCSPSSQSDTDSSVDTAPVSEVDVVEIIQEVESEAFLEMESLNWEDADENRVELIQTTYNNGTDVNMEIRYSVDEDNMIQTINVFADNYDLSRFNDKAQDLIGTDRDYAEDFYVSGSSLTTQAFQKAMKQ